MKTTRIGINGFGRIGRVTLRLLSETEGVEVVAINDLTPLAQSAHLLQYDSVHGPWKRSVGFGKESLTIDNHPISVFARRDPSEIPWKEVGADVVIESTGIFTTD